MAVIAVDYEALDEPELVALLRAGDSLAARTVIRRNNQRLFRAAWSVLRDRAEAEDAVQEAYLKAFARIGSFEGGAALSTWLTRIVVNTAITRLRAIQRRARSLKAFGLTVLQDHRERLGETASRAPAAEETLMRRELAQLLEGAISRLPEPFRLVFVLHEIERLSPEEIAESVGAPIETVRTRLFRARRRLRADLGPELRRTLDASIAFAGADCDALTARVMAALEPRFGGRSTS